MADDSEIAKNIVTLGEAQLYVGNSTPDMVARLELAIKTVSGKIDDFLGYQVMTATYTDVVVSGNGTSVLELPQGNVTAISKIEYRSGKSTWTELDSSYYEVDDITRLGAIGYEYLFGRGTRNWRVSYTAGWSRGLIPGTIVEVCLEEVRRFISSRPDTISENIGGQSAKGTSYFELDPVSKRKLTAFRKIYL